MKKLILFDFDGTIANTLQTGLDIINRNPKYYGVSIKQEELELLRGKTPHELIQHFKIPLYKLPFFARTLHRELSLHMQTIQLFPDLKKILENLKKSNKILTIVTSNTKKNVELFLDAHSICAFDFIHSEKNIFGKHKTIEKVIHDNKVKKEDVIYIGDEVRDIEAARKAGIECISVTWGYNTKSILEKHKPTYIVDSPQALQKLLEKI